MAYISKPAHPYLYARICRFTFNVAITRYFILNPFQLQQYIFNRGNRSRYKKYKWSTNWTNKPHG